MPEPPECEDPHAASPPAHEPRPLDVVQRWLQAVIMHPGGVAAGVDSEAARAEIATSPAEIEHVIGRSQSLGSLDRLAVYGNAYYARLLECLREVFPIVCRTMGERIFNHFAFVYLQRYPSQSYTLGELGQRFADFLAESRPAETEQPPPEAEAESELSPDWPQFVVDLARLEWTIGQVYDGPGMEQRTGLSAADLAAIPPDKWPNVRLKLAPCVRLLAFRFPVNDYFAAMRELERDEEELPASADSENPIDEAFVPIPPPQETYLALSRRNYIVHRYPLTKVQFTLLQELESGATIEQAVTAAAAGSTMSDDELAAALHEWFAIWTANDFFITAELEP
jgi:hypothetical protein